MIYSHFNSFTSIYSEQEMTGGLNDAQFNRVNQFYMETAQNTAVYQAFKLANKPYELKYEGVYVLDIAKNSTFKINWNFRTRLQQSMGKNLNQVQI